MDLPALASVLQLALSVNPDERKAGEERLNQLYNSPGHLVGLLQIIVEPTLEIPVRQVASIHFKNLISRHWKSSNVVEQIREADKRAIRENVLEALVQAPPIIRVQLGDALKTLIHCDYSERWPSLLSSISANLRQPDQQRVYGALFALRILTRKYEFKDDEERTPVYQIIDTTFPTLLEIFRYLLLIANPPIEVANLIKLICKIFWSSTYLEIPRQLHDTNTFTAWMACFHNLLERPVPQEGQPSDQEQRNAWGWWKVKKWTVHIMNRLFNRFGDPKNVRPENRPWAQLFQTQFAGMFLESHLKLLGIIRHGGYLPDRVTNLVLQYLSTSISKPTTYQLLKPQLDIVLFEIIFPLMCFNDTDDKLWHEDPHEYVRKGYDIIEDMYSPRTAAINFVSELVRKQGKENLQKFLAFVVEVFRRYDEALPGQKLFRQKDGGLLAIGALSDKLKQTEPYKSQLEQMLVQHVFTEFKSPAGHLRAKAAWVSGQYANISFSDQRHFSSAMCSIVAALKDPELPVRVDSVVALRSFVEACKDLNELRPILPQLLDEFFKLMNEVENEDLVFTLETIVDKFGEEMAPFALGLCQNLASAFWKCLHSSEADRDEDESGALAAVGCLRAISTILESISSLPHLFPHIEPIILPIMQKMLTKDGQDVFEEVLDIVSYMTYYSPTISMDMWSLWPLIVSAAEDWAIDFFENILTPLDNYISRSTEHFLTCKAPDYQKSLFKMISSLLSEQNLEDSDVEPAPKLIEIVLQNCRGRIDEWIEPYIRIAIDRLRRTQKNYLKDLLIAVVANGLYYNAALTLNVLQNLGATAEIFQLWLQLIYRTKKSGSPLHFRREHDKKVCILGLASLFPLPVEALPRELQLGFDQVFKVVLRLLVAYKEQKAESERKVQNSDEDGEVEELESDEEDGSKDPGEDDEDGEEVTSRRLHKLVATQTNVFHARDEDDGDDDDDSEDGFTDDDEFQAPIDDIDPFIFFSDALKSLSIADPPRFQVLTQSLDFQHQAMAHGVTQHAEERKKDIQKASAKASA